MGLKTIAFLAFLPALSGCISPEERAARRVYEMNQIELSKKSYCTSHGAAVGTREYTECRSYIERVEQAQRMGQPTINDIGNAALMGIANDTYMSPGMPYPQRTRCITKQDLYGTSIITECQ